MKFNGFNYPKNILDVVVIDGRTVRDFVKPEFFFSSSDGQSGWNSFGWQEFNRPKMGRLFIDRICMVRYKAVYYPEPYTGKCFFIVEW